MKARCPTHDHPELDEPISERELRAEFLALTLLGEIGGDFTFELSDKVGARHDGDPRAYAEVQPELREFRFAPQVRWLPRANRLGLMAHEIGHVIDPTGTEDGADAAFERRSGLRIRYDTRWPGKGIQRLEMG